MKLLLSYLPLSLAFFLVFLSTQLVKCETGKAIDVDDAQGSGLAFVLLVGFVVMFVLSLFYLLLWWFFEYRRLPFGGRTVSLSSPVCANGSVVGSSSSGAGAGCSDDEPLSVQRLLLQRDIELLSLTKHES